MKGVISLNSGNVVMLKIGCTFIYRLCVEAMML